MEAFNGYSQTVTHPITNPIQQGLTSVFDENQCVPYGMVGQGKGAKLLFGF